MSKKRWLLLVPLCDLSCIEFPTSVFPAADIDPTGPLVLSVNFFEQHKSFKLVQDLFAFRAEQPSIESVTRSFPTV